MIKFFRKIRQNLLMEDKTGKYFKYAIGEIVLVVIGILIALQINNWNEQRKIQDDLTLSLIQIKNDLQQDEIHLKGYYSGDIKRIGHLTKISNSNSNDIPLDSLLYDLDNYFYFYKSNNSYTGLKDNGMFSSMKNNNLKNSLTSYYEQMYERLKTVSQYGETFTNDQVIPYILINIEYDENRLVKKELVQEKLETTNLKQLIKYQLSVKKFAINLMKNAILMNAKLKVEIENELEKLK
jgi:hypothetical protein